VRLVANGGAEPVIVDDDIDLDALPEDCRKVTVAPVKTAIGKRLKAGEVVPGARLGTRGSSIRFG
jgi:hypothetical protein